MFSTPKARRKETAHCEAAEEVIDFFDLQPYRDKLIAGLPYGIKKLVELARPKAQLPRCRQPLP